MKQRHYDNKMPTQYMRMVNKISSEWNGFKINQCWQILSSSICIPSISQQYRMMFTCTCIILVKQSIHMHQQIITKWYCLRYKVRELTSLVFMNNDNLEYRCLKGKFMFFVVIIHNIWDNNIIFNFACSHIVKAYLKTIKWEPFQ
jgi:hypothetical protein